jgi:hypothetical protein
MRRGWDRREAKKISHAVCQLALFAARLVRGMTSPRGGWSSGLQPQGVFRGKFHGQKTANFVPLLGVFRHFWALSEGAQKGRL